MSALLDLFDAAEIFVLDSVDAISVEDARNQLQSHKAVDVMIEGFHQHFTDSIMAEGCATPRLFLERTLASLPPTLGRVYSAAMIACDETPVRCEKQSPEGTLSFALVFCFRVRSYYAARQVVAMFNGRFDSRPIAERLSVFYVPIPHIAVQRLPLSRPPTRRACKPPTQFDAAIPAVKLKRRFPYTHPDPLPALRDSRLSFCRVRCAVLQRSTSLVRLADGNVRVV